MTEVASMLTAGLTSPLKQTLNSPQLQLRLFVRIRSGCREEKHHSGLLQKHLDEELSRIRAADTENASKRPLKGSDRRRAKAPSLKIFKKPKIMGR